MATTRRPRLLSDQKSKGGMHRIFGSRNSRPCLQWRRAGDGTALAVRAVQPPEGAAEQLLQTVAAGLLEKQVEWRLEE